MTISKVWLISGMAIILLVVGFGSGFLTGRMFPAHHYDRLGQTSYLFDSSTGFVCDPFQDPNKPFDFDKALQSANSASQESGAVDLSKIYGSNQSNLPPCRKQK
jgi:hypothetical protein